MLFKKILSTPAKKSVNLRDSENGCEIKALLQVSSQIKELKEFNKVLEIVAQGVWHCLNAHRVSIFTMDEKNGILKTLFSFAAEPQYEQIGLFEEKEIARKALKSKKTFRLNGPKDFAEFFQYEKRERKITSLISLPLEIPGKSTAILSVVLINTERNFTEKELDILNLFAHQVSLAAEITDLREEIRKAIEFRKEYEKHLDDILIQLQNLSLEEQHRIEEHIKSLMPIEQAPKIVIPSPSPNIDMSSLTGLLPGEITANEGALASNHIEVQAEDITVDEDLVSGGVFIRTPNPLDLGEQFPMKLYLSPSEAPIEVNAKVIWTNKYGHESKGLHRGMGVKFLDLHPEVQRKVEEYLQAQKLKWNAPPEVIKSN
ncbi:MAG: PilZ domain-containing protein [Thermodesulfobacteriota bacterium]